MRAILPARESRCKDPFSACVQRDVAEPAPVVAYDLARGLFRERELAKGLGGVGVLGVAVGMVREEHKTVVAEPVDPVEARKELGEQ